LEFLAEINELPT